MSTSSSSSPDDSSSSSPLILRLHLIRHGETESNHSKLVLGQADSPLTPRGISQACATGKYLSCKQQTEGFAYWKLASSDLKRCRDTTDHILNAMAMNEERRDYDAKTKIALEEIVVDERLRERAKGVREGRPKSLSTEEAMKEHKAEEETEGVSKPIPKFETEEEVWIRMHDFVKSTLQEAMENHRTTNAAQQQ